VHRDYREDYGGGIKVKPMDGKFSKFQLGYVNDEI
jgi:hypothetical protein